MVRRFAGLAWLAFLSLSISTTLRADDPPSKLLDDAATRMKLAKDALRASVDAAISKAGKLPADAGVIVLQSAENDVNEATFLTAQEKKSFLAELVSKRKSLESGVPAAPAKPARVTTKDELEITERIREELKAIKALDQSGQGTVARGRLKSLMDKYPDHPALLAYAEVTARQGMAKDQTRINSTRKNNEGTALSDVNTGTVPPNGSIAYDPEKWAKAKKRPPAGSVTNNLSSREKEILKVLDQPSKTEFNLNNTNFADVVKQLERELGFNLVISKATMEEVRITYESALTYQIPKNVSKRTLLKSVLAELGLTYIIKGELVQVVSFLQAKNELRVGVLDVSTMLRTGSSANDLIKLIKTTVEPDSWEGAGGNGSITFHPPGIFIIKNSAEVIYQLGARPK